MAKPRKGKGYISILELIVFRCLPMDAFLATVSFLFLVSTGLNKQIAKDVNARLKLANNYLWADYKLHVSRAAHFAVFMH